MYNQLPDIIQISSLKSHNSLETNCVIDYNSYVIDYQSGIFKNNSQESQLKFLNGNQRPINRWLGTWNSLERVTTEVSEQHWLILSKQNCLITLKIFLGQNNCKFNKESWSIFSCNILLLKREFFFFLFLFKEICLRDQGSLKL